MKTEKTSFVRIETGARNQLRAYCKKNKAVMGVVASRIISDWVTFTTSRESKRKAVKK